MELTEIHILLLKGRLEGIYQGSRLPLSKLGINCSNDDLTEAKR